MNLQIREIINFSYGGTHIDFAYPFDLDTGEPFHLLSKYSLSKAKNGTHKTIKSSYGYIYQLKKYFEEFIDYNSLDWREVSNEDIISYLSYFQFKENRLSARTIELQRQAIISFYTWAYQYGHIDFCRLNIVIRKLIFYKR